MLADVTRILADKRISIEAILQKEAAADELEVPIILLTHSVREGQMNEAIQQIEALDSICASVTRIRLEHLNAN